jgi:hypothetical protein
VRGLGGRGGEGSKGRSEGKGREMTQTLYAHMNKIKIKKDRVFIGLSKVNSGMTIGSNFAFIIFCVYC